MSLKLIKFYQIFYYKYQNVLLHLIYFSGIDMSVALFRLSISEAHPLSISVALGLYIHFTGTSSSLNSLYATQIKTSRKKNAFFRIQLYTYERSSLTQCSYIYLKGIFLICRPEFHTLNKSKEFGDKCLHKRFLRLYSWAALS